MMYKYMHYACDKCGKSANYLKEGGRCLWCGGAMRERAGCLTGFTVFTHDNRDLVVETNESDPRHDRVKVEAADIADLFLYILTEFGDALRFTKEEEALLEALVMEGKGAEIPDRTREVLAEWNKVRESYDEGRGN